MAQRKPKEPWVPRDFIVLTHNGRMIRAHAATRPTFDWTGGCVKIGESRFYSVAAILDPDNAEFV